MAYKLRSGAAVWWEKLQIDRRRRGKPHIRSWRRMKQLMMNRFLPPDYEQFIFQSYQNCVQGNRSVADYSEEWLRLAVRNDLNETDAQQVSRYLNGLKPSIRDKIGLQVVWTVDEAHNLALKAELLEKTSGRFTNYRRDVGESSNMAANKNKSNLTPEHNFNKPKPTANQPQKNTNNLSTMTRAPNPYAKTGGLKCYRCNQPGHRSNECPQRKSVNLVEMDEDDEYEHGEAEGEDNEDLEGA